MLALTVAYSSFERGGLLLAGQPDTTPVNDTVVRGAIKVAVGGSSVASYELRASSV